MGICKAGGAAALASPGGEAVERSETDEERRNGPILHAVRKEGTI